MNMIMYSECRAGFGWGCSICRDTYRLETNRVKHYMATHCPAHAKAMTASHGGEVVVVHTACDSGCFACGESDLTVRALTDMATPMP